MPKSTESGALKHTLRGGPGFATGFCLTDSELQHVRQIIEAQWLDRIGSSRPDLLDEFRELGCARYHEKSHLLEHHQLWGKPSRLLSAEQVRWFRQTSLVKALEAELGEIVISDEDRHGWEEVYWRLVRPNEPGDINSVHADYWFAELRDEHYVQGLDHVKCWIAIITEPGLNGLAVLPYSHQREYRYHGEERQGKVVPVIDEDIDSLGLELLELAPGEAVAFDVRLLHAGVLNRATTTRISLEFELLVQPF